jgi:mRNA interferase RelE/StbE
MLDIRYTDDALKDLKSIGRVAAKKVMDKIRAYAAHPAGFGNQVKKLRGVDALRLRVGDYRVLFNEDGVVLSVLRIGHRRNIYR